MTGAAQKLVRAAAVLSAIALPVDAALAQGADQGRRLVTTMCSGCHAVDRTGASPLPNAPLFRKLADRLDLNELQDRMREGLSSTHPGMPTFRFSRSEAQAVRVYLSTIQE
jgi:mono/diheme cytochrome c family protein